MNSIVTAPLPGTVPDPKYPDSDGRPMGDTDFHNLALTGLRQGLEDHFAGVPDVYVASNLIVYYQEGDPRKRRDPDVLVAKKVGKHKRRFFRIWEEETVPRVLWEIVSRKTWRIDVGEKRRLYARLGVQEYFLFDPEIRYLNPPLQGFRMVNGKSVPMKPNADGSLTSKELGLRFLADGDRVRLFDVKTGQEVLSRRERAEAEKERAEAGTLRAEREKERANLEKKRADELQAEVDRLRRRLQGG
jgi:Uma2 family endonuclease